MTNHKAKETIKTIWERYARTLKLLDKALDELDKKPKEVIVEVEKPLPPTLEEVASTNEILRKQLDDLIQWRLRAKMYKAENEKLEKENEKLKEIPLIDKNVEKVLTHFKELYEVIIHVYNNLNKDIYLLTRKCLKIVYDKVKGIIIKYNGF